MLDEEDVAKTENETVESISEENITSNDESNEDQGVKVDEKVAEITDQMLRVQAEMQNLRKRTETEIDKARKFAVERFAKGLFDVVDNLERALASVETLDVDSDKIAPFTEGVSLTLKTFQECMKQNNIEVIDPKGEPFDPQFHQAVSTVSSEDAEPNSILEVFQKGYSLNSRVIRPAMVVVSKV
jgi:molecular chaperone GrpE